jgi:hypothetical protein
MYTTAPMSKRQCADAPDACCAPARPAIENPAPRGRWRLRPAVLRRLVGTGRPRHRLRRLRHTFRPLRQETTTHPILACTGNQAGTGGASVVTRPAGDHWLVHHAGTTGAIGHEIGGARSVHIVSLTWHANQLDIGRRAQRRPSARGRNDCKTLGGDAPVAVARDCTTTSSRSNYPARRSVAWSVTPAPVDGTWKSTAESAPRPTWPLEGERPASNTWAARSVIRHDPQAKSWGDPMRRRLEERTANSRPTPGGTASAKVTERPGMSVAPQPGRAGQAVDSSS